MSWPSIFGMHMNQVRVSIQIPKTFSGEICFSLLRCNKWMKEEAGLNRALSKVKANLLWNNNAFLEHSDQYLFILFAMVL